MRNPLVNADAQRAPIMIWTLIVMRLDGETMKDVREAALGCLEEATRHKDERISQAAAQALQAVQRFQALKKGK